MKWISNKTLFNIHGWLGLNLGLLLFVICFSGTFATLSNEVDWLLNSDMRIEQKDEPVQWDKMYRSLTEAFPDGTVLSIYKNTYGVTQESFAAGAFVSLTNGQTRKVYLNPYSGEIQGHTGFFDVQRFFRSYHRRFFDGEQGIFIVTLSSFFLLFSVLTGFLFYKGWLKNLFKLRLKSGIKALWSDVHKLTGIWSLLFALLIALTGIFYFAEVVLQNANSYNVLLPDGPPETEQADLAGYGPNPELLPLDVYVAHAKKAFPELEVQSLRIPHQPGGYIYIDGQAGNPIVRNRANKIYLHPFTGEVVHIQKSSDLNTAELITDIADPLHFGYFGGLPVKILWFIFGLGISFAILSGTYVWYVRKMKKIKRKKNRKHSSSGGADSKETGVLATAGFFARQITASRGAVLSTVIVLLYLFSTGFSIVRDGIHSYGPLPEERFVKIEQAQLGPWAVDLICEYPCKTEPGTSYFARIYSSGIPNYDSANLQLTTLSGDTLKVPFSGNARKPSLTLDERFKNVDISQIQLSVRSHKKEIFTHTVEMEKLRKAQHTVNAHFDEYPERSYPDVSFGIYAFILFFTLLTSGVIVAWTWFLYRQLRASSGRK